jgi:hypothetical protein
MRVPEHPHALKDHQQETGHRARVPPRGNLPLRVRPDQRRAISSTAALTTMQPRLRSSDRDSAANVSTSARTAGSASAFRGTVSGSNAFVLDANPI